LKFNHRLPRCSQKSKTHLASVSGGWDSGALTISNSSAHSFPRTETNRRTRILGISKLIRRKLHPFVTVASKVVMMLPNRPVGCKRKVRFGSGVVTGLRLAGTGQSPVPTRTHHFLSQVFPASALLQISWPLVESIIISAGPRGLPRTSSRKSSFCTSFRSSM
jgi:hypothetical protein